MSDSLVPRHDQIHRPDFASSSRLVVLAGFACVAAGVVASSTFLPHQNLWNDESAQMSGLTLDPVDQLRWLAGWRNYHLGVADDRMPPLSYWVGWAWSHAFGLQESTMRWLGVVQVALATLLVFLAGRRAWGLAAGVASALLFALSPNVVVASVEIRAYPLFLLTSTATFHALIRYLDAPTNRRLAWLSLCAVAGIYTHFFGLVAAGAAFVAALALGPRRGGKLAPLLVAIAFVALATTGIAPFVLTSFGHSDSGPGDPLKVKLGLLAGLAFRLVAHPTMLVFPASFAPCGLGASILAIAAFARKRPGIAIRPDSDPAPGNTPGLALTLALVSGGAVVILARLALSRFNAAGGNYNLWMMPLLALLAGSGLAAASPLARRAASVGLALLLASFLAGDLELARHGGFFAHGSHHAIDAWVRRLGPGRVAVVLDVDNATAWDVYSPLRYQYAGALPQYQLDARSPAPDVRVTPYAGDPLHPGPSLDPATLPHDYLLVVRSENLRSNQVVAQLRNGVVPLGDGPVARALKADPRWTLGAESTNVAFVTADIDVFRRKPAEPSSTPKAP